MFDLVKACEKMKHPVWLSILGNSLLVTSFIFLGPAPSLQNSIRPSLGYMYGIITIFGVGYSLIMITTFTRALRAMKALGYDTEETNTQMVATGTNKNLKIVSSKKQDFSQKLHVTAHVDKL